MLTESKANIVCMMGIIVSEKRDLIRRFMLLSHELGHEIDYDGTVKRAEELCKYLIEQEGNTDADLEYSLRYLCSILEKKQK